ncbi:hypothetical protein CP8484711_0699A, partial [Chlamydia psittaci 84-8471/1]
MLLYAHTPVNWY